MFRFFRKIRLKPFHENKVTRYILYGLGEIILIVIGILIAMEIGNWNEQRKIRQLEQVYLEGLRSEFGQNKTKLENLISVNRLNYEEARQISHFISEGEFPDEKQLSKHLYNAFSYEISYNPNNSLLNEIISAGYLKYISNGVLRQELTSWESVIQGIHRQEASLRDQRENVIDIFRSGAGSMRTILEGAGVAVEEMGLVKSDKSISNVEVLRSREFENSLLPYILTGMATETSHYNPLLDKINHILKLIDAETE